MTVHIQLPNSYHSQKFNPDHKRKKKRTFLCRLTVQGHILLMFQLSRSRYTHSTKTWKKK